MLGWLMEFLIERKWELYPFLPSLMAIAVCLIIGPLHTRRLQNRLSHFLETEGLEKYFSIIDGIAQDRVLQISFVATLTSIVASIVAVIKADHVWLLMTLSLISILGGIVVSIDLFSRAPGFQATTRVRDPPVLRSLPKKEWTRLDLYNVAFAATNVILILIIIAAWPIASQE